MHSTRPCALGAAQRLGAGVSSLRARAPPRVSSVGGRRAPSTEARLRPGRQGVQRIYRLTSEKAQMGVYEYLESIGVPRVNALQVQSKAGEWFEYENAKRGGAANASFGVREMAQVVDFLEARGVSKDDVGALGAKHPPVLAYDVETRLEPLFEYLGELGLDTDGVVANLTRRPNLLGLDPDQNMRRMVDYLVANGSTQEQALEYLLKTL